MIDEDNQPVAPLPSVGRVFRDLLVIAVTVIIIGVLCSLTPSRWWVPVAAYCGGCCMLGIVDLWFIWRTMQP